MSTASYIFSNSLTELTCSELTFHPHLFFPLIPNLGDQILGVIFSAAFPSSHRASQWPSPHIAPSTASRPVLPSCSYLQLSESPHKCLLCFQITSLQSSSLFLILLPEKLYIKNAYLVRLHFYFKSFNSSRTIFRVKSKHLGKANNTHRDSPLACSPACLPITSPTPPTIDLLSQLQLPDKLNSFMPPSLCLCLHGFLHLKCPSRLCSLVEIPVS